MRYLLIDQGQLQIVTDAGLSLASLTLLVGGGYYSMPFAYDGGTSDTYVALVVNADGRSRRLAPNVYVPELLEVVVGPVVLVGFTTEAELRSLTDEEIARFRLVQVVGTSVPRLERVARITSA